MQQQQAVSEGWELELRGYTPPPPPKKLLGSTKQSAGLRHGPAKAALPPTSTMTLNPGALEFCLSTTSRYISRSAAAAAAAAAAPPPPTLQPVPPAPPPLNELPCAGPHSSSSGGGGGRQEPASLEQAAITTTEAAIASADRRLQASASDIRCGLKGDAEGHPSSAAAKRLCSVQSM